MKTISKDITNEIAIKNSRFITVILKITSANISDILKNLKIKYPKATHYCYAYIYDNIKHSFDDKEPGGTAGIPILNVLEKADLNNVLCVVIRYFGGIKLGAGGLVRAYTKAVTECLKNVELINLEKGYQVKIIFNYEDEKQINYLLKNMTIISKSYEQKISYIVLVPQTFINKLYSYNYQIVNEIYIEKLTS